MELLYRISKGILYPFESAWHRYFRVEGKENVPREGPLIAAIDEHGHFFDPVHVAVKYPRILHFMATKYLFETPIIRKLARWFGAYPVDRLNLKPSTIRESLDILKEGEALGIFITGTTKQYRSDGITPVSPKGGAAGIALKAVEKGISVKISPVLLEGTRDMYQCGGRMPFRRRLRMKVGETIDPSEFDSVDELTDAIWNSIQELK